MLKIRARVADLRAAVKAVAMAANTTALTNVTSRVCIRATDGKCFVEATDYDTEAVAELANCEVIGDGAALPPIGLLEKVLAPQPQDATVLLTADDKHRMRMEVGRGSVTLNGISPDEWPEMGGFEFTAPVDLDAAAFRDLLLSVAYARHRNDMARQSLMGVFLQLTPVPADGTLEISARATDGHRMAMNTVAFPVTDLPDRPIAILVPGEVVRKILPRLAEATVVQMAIHRSREQPIAGAAVTHVRFTFDGTTMLTTKTIQENFPPFEKILGLLDPVMTIAVPQDKLLTAIESLGMVIGRTTPLTLAVRKGALQLYATRSGEASGLLTVDGRCEILTSDKIKPFGVPLHQLRDAVQRCGAMVELRPSADLVPLELRTADSTGVHQQIIAQAKLDEPLPADRMPVDEEDDEDAA